MFSINQLLNYLSNKNTLKYWAVLILILLLVPLPVITPLSVGLDPSWQLALNMGIKEKLIFGEDFVYTYGPLAFLVTGISYFVSPILIWSFYIIIVLSSLMFAFYIAQSLNKSWAVIIFLVSLVFLSNGLLSRDSIVILFLFLFFIFSYIQTKRIAFLIFSSGLALLSFYIKLNTGLIINVLLLINLLYVSVFDERIRKISVIVIIIHFLTLYSMSFFLNTSFLKYIENTLQIINSYNDAVSLEPNKLILLSALIIIFSLSFCFIMNIKQIIKSKFELLLLFNVYFFLYILFKQAFLRADLGHVYIFFYVITFLIVFYYASTHSKQLKNQLQWIWVFSVFVCLLVFFIKKPYHPYTSFDSFEKCQSFRKLPQNIISKIGKNSVDVLGHENSFIFYNNFKYNPRPIFQSYAAYNKQLINLNCQKYDSKSAPDFVIYHLASIDGRNIFWDEPRIYLSLFKNYDVANIIPETQNYDKMILFKHKRKSLPLHEKIITQKLIKFNQTVKIPTTNNITYLTLSYSYTKLGKIKRLLYQPSIVYMELTDESGKKETYRLVLPIMESGVPINKKVGNIDDAVNFFETFGKCNKRFVSFKLTGNCRWVTDEFKATFTEYSHAN